MEFYLFNTLLLQKNQKQIPYWPINVCLNMNNFSRNSTIESIWCQIYSTQFMTLYECISLLAMSTKNIQIFFIPIRTSKRQHFFVFFSRKVAAGLNTDLKRFKLITFTTLLWDYYFKSFKLWINTIYFFFDKNKKRRMPKK